MVQMTVGNQSTIELFFYRSERLTDFYFTDSLLSESVGRAGDLTVKYGSAKLNHSLNVEQITMLFDKFYL